MHSVYSVHTEFGRLIPYKNNYAAQTNLRYVIFITAYLFAFEVDGT